MKFAILVLEKVNECDTYVDYYSSYTVVQSITDWYELPPEDVDFLEKNLSLLNKQGTVYILVRQLDRENELKDIFEKINSVLAAEKIKKQKEKEKLEAQKLARLKSQEAYYRI